MARMLGGRTARRTALLLGIAACSTVPADRYPAFEEHRVTATWHFEGGEPRAAVPASNDHLVVLELRSTPPFLREVFEGGQRYLLPPPACTELTVQCRYRAYAQDGAVPTPLQLFPGATTLVQDGN